MYFRNVFVLFIFHHLNAGSLYHPIPIPIDNDMYDFPTMSLSKKLFSLVINRERICQMCKVKTTSVSETNCVTIVPQSSGTIKQLIINSFSETIMKLCSDCNRNTTHEANYTIIQPPAYLIITINRFEYRNAVYYKNKTAIPVDLFTRSGNFNFRLTAILDHHGHYINSGHYTSSIFCSDRIYYCNDHKITQQIAHKRDSNTAYIMLYKLMDD